MGLIQCKSSLVGNCFSNFAILALSHAALCFSKVVTGEIAKVLKAYGCLSVTGDRFAAEWPIGEFREHGIAYEQCEQNKSELYLAFVPVTNSRGVELPEDKRLLTELRRLERKRGRMGKDTVDHPPRLHDDLANAVAGVAHLLSSTVENSRAKPFNPILHISKETLKIAVGNWPLFLGLSQGEGIVASVIGQIYNREIRIFAAFSTENMSLRRHLSEYPKSWLSSSPCRLRIMGGYEDMDPEIKSEMHHAAQEILGGEWVTVSRPWEIRRNAVLDALTRAQPFTFRPIVQINPANTTPLSRVLNRGVYEKAQIENKDYHTFNAFALLLSRLELWKSAAKDPKPPRMPPSAMSA